jgi:hypothetical protein
MEYKYFNNLLSREVELGFRAPRQVVVITGNPTA